MRWILLVLGLMLTSSGSSQEYRATTTGDAVLRQAPGQQYSDIGRVPAGTNLEVGICFGRGAYCAVSYSKQTGFVSGEVLTVDATGRTVRDIEAERWAAIDARQLRGRLPDWEARNVVVWGDSLSTNTFGPKLESLLPGRDVVMQGVPGEDGAAISRRRIASDAFDSRITVIWDRHYTGEDADRYIADLQPIFDRLQDDRYVVLSDIRSMGSDLDVDADRRITDATNALLRRAHPDNFLDLTDVLENPSLRTDGLHLTPGGNDLVAQRLAEFITRKGW